jgi:hypothetical protein
MAKKRSVDPNAIFDFADQVALISGQILKYRIKNRVLLSQPEKEKLEDLEVQLDRLTAKVRAAGIATLGNLQSDARMEVEAAAKSAEGFLRRIRRLERVLGVATAVVGLALAAVSGQSQGIVTALKDVKDAVEGDATSTT